MRSEDKRFLYSANERRLGGGGAGSGEQVQLGADEFCGCIEALVSIDEAVAETVAVNTVEESTDGLCEALEDKKGGVTEPERG